MRRTAIALFLCAASITSAPAQDLPDFYGKWADIKQTESAILISGEGLPLASYKLGAGDETLDVIKVTAGKRFVRHYIVEPGAYTLKEPDRQSVISFQAKPGLFTILEIVKDNIGFTGLGIINKGEGISKNGLLSNKFYPLLWQDWKTQKEYKSRILQTKRTDFYIEVGRRPWPIPDPGDGGDEKE